MHIYYALSLFSSFVYIEIKAFLQFTKPRVGGKSLIVFKG